MTVMKKAIITGMITLLCLGALFYLNHSMTGEVVLPQKTDLPVRIIRLEHENISSNDLMRIINAFNITVEDERVVYDDSVEGLELIKKYNIEKIPALIVSKEALAYEKFRNAWPKFGSVEDDGMFVFRTVNPPFKDVKTGEIHNGGVVIAYILDDECLWCYDPVIHRSVLEEDYGVRIKEEKTYRVQDLEGELIREAYNIVALPTIILSPEAQDYPYLMMDWVNVGTVEWDGKLVFRNLFLIPNARYRNLTDGEIWVGGAGPTSEILLPKLDEQE